jgi:hypothetical protein
VQLLNFYPVSMAHNGNTGDVSNVIGKSNIIKEREKCD